MALPMPPNCTVDIYRTTAPANPYTLGAAGKKSVKGYLQPRVQTGRHGTASWLKWTHILYVDATVDVRDAYNTQIDPARDNTKGDTLILTSTDGTTTTAFYVAFVEAALRGTNISHLRVYLDRFQPKLWPTDAL
ncbi:MAG TPA: hypothetical protein VG013_24100 [Gemmataceae bacterium]|jgi:hypothetical protein|nr:hypothetical protein [Gemmataceae bacterium]